MITPLLRRELLLCAALALIFVGTSPSHAQNMSGGQAPEATCTLDAEKQPLPDDGASLVGFQDVIVGPSEAEVTVIEYFDPNCPHCKTFHDVMKEVVANYKDKVRFVFKPFPLRGSSIPEIQALYVAHQQGKFTQMLEAQYQRQSRTGITSQDLRAIASDIGMDADVMMSKIKQNKYREKIVRQRKRAMAAGVDSTPTVLVNGHFAESRTRECLASFIERAQSGTLASSASR